jgi:hypothetical protein
MDNKISVAGNDSLNAITSKLNGQGTGDQYYRRNTIMLNDAPGSTGIALISGSTAGGGPNTNVVFADSRIEKGTYGIHFIKDSQATLYNVVVNNVTWQPDKSGFASAFGFGDDQLTLKNLTMAHNNVVPGSAISSSFYQLSGSRITESYGPIIVRATSAGNIYTLFANASVTMPAASASNVVLRPAGPAHHN